MLVLSMVCSKAFNRQTKWFGRAVKSILRICGTHFALSFLFCDERRLQEPLEEPQLSTHWLSPQEGDRQSGWWLDGP